jgi:hypothetical protein
MYWFWTAFVGMVLLWYILVTALVGYRGARDIRQMFKSVKETTEKNDQ